MGVTQYTGSRYVPIFADPADWNSTRTYEPLTIVTNEGNSYTSKQYVPKGVDISNADYWAETGNYNAQVESYRREVLECVDDVAVLQKTAINHRSATTESELQKYINDDVAAHTITIIDSAAMAGTVYIPANAVVFIDRVEYTGTDFAFKFNGGSNSRIYINTMLCESGGGFDLSTGCYMSGGSITIDYAECFDNVFRYKPDGDNVSWAQYIELSGNRWVSKKANVISCSCSSTISNTQWLNSVTIRRISLECSNPNYGIECINRDYDSTLFGFDQWYLEGVSFEKCFKGIHGYSITGWKSKGLRAEETTNTVLTVSGFCSDCEFEFSTFIKTNNGLPFITSNNELNTCIVKAPLYTDINMKSNPIVTKMLCGKNVVVPIETNKTTFAFPEDGYSVPSDYTSPQPTYFGLNDNVTFDLGNDYYGIGKIDKVYLSAYADTLTGCNVKVNGVTTNIKRPGLYAITSSNKLFNVTGVNG